MANGQWPVASGQWPTATQKPPKIGRILMKIDENSSIFCETPSKPIEDHRKPSPEVSKSTIFPNVFQQLLSSCDIGSQISLMFEKIKDFLDQEVQTRRNVLLTLLQPIVILTMGVFVMLIVLAIMLPLLQMNNLIFTL